MQKNQLKTTEIVVNQEADAVKAPFLTPPTGGGRYGEV